MQLISLSINNKILYLKIDSYSRWRIEVERILNVSLNDRTFADSLVAKKNNFELFEIGQSDIGIYYRRHWLYYNNWIFYRIIDNYNDCIEKTLYGGNYEQR